MLPSANGIDPRHDKGQQNDLPPNGKLSAAAGQSYYQSFEGHDVAEAAIRPVRNLEKWLPLCPFGQSLPTIERRYIAAAALAVIQCRGIIPQTSCLAAG